MSHIITCGRAENSCSKQLCAKAGVGTDDFSNWAGTDDAWEHGARRSFLSLTSTS
eukprot:COSAG01_NODE_471_length_16555_cov_14.196524_5_plen_55_part_00